MIIDCGCTPTYLRLQPARVIPALPASTPPTEADETTAARRAAFRNNSGKDSRENLDRIKYVIPVEVQLEEICSAIDRVFAKLGQEPLINNKEFFIDSQAVSDSFMRFCSIPKSGRIEVNLEITSAGITFWIDKTREMPDVSYNMIKENTGRFEELIEMMFTSIIHAEYKGQRTILSFINSIDDVIIGQFKFQSGLWPNWFSSRTTKIYEPYFEV